MVESYSSMINGPSAGLSVSPARSITVVSIQPMSPPKNTWRLEGPFRLDTGRSKRSGVRDSWDKPRAITRRLTS